MKTTHNKRLAERRKLQHGDVLCAVRGLMDVDNGEQIHERSNLFGARHPDQLQVTALNHKDSWVKGHRCKLHSALTDMSVFITDKFHSSHFSGHYNDMLFFSFILHYLL